MKIVRRMCVVVTLGCGVIVSLATPPQQTSFPIEERVELGQVELTASSPRVIAGSVQVSGPILQQRGIELRVSLTGVNRSVSSTALHLTMLEPALASGEDSGLSSEVFDTIRGGIAGEPAQFSSSLQLDLPPGYSGRFRLQLAVEGNGEIVAQGQLFARADFALADRKDAAVTLQVDAP